MKKKKNISISIDPLLFEMLEKNFDNKSSVIEWFIIDGLSKNKEFKKRIEDSYEKI